MFWIAGKAKRAYAALLALDPSTTERKELAASGVSSGRITALFPDEGFDSLVPGLIEYLELVPASRLAARSASGRAPINRVADALPQGWVTKADSPFAAQQHITEGDLFRYLLGRIESTELHTFLNYDHAYYHAVDLARAIVWAHWTMGHASQIPRPARRHGYRLMLMVAGAIDLPTDRSSK